MEFLRGQNQFILSCIQAVFSFQLFYGDLGVTLLRMYLKIEISQNDPRGFISLCPLSFPHCALQIS